MTVGILIIAHNGIGNELIATAQQMLACCKLPPVKVLSMNMDDETDSMEKQLNNYITDLNQGEGVLILTDMFGSTPSNIACTVASDHPVHIVSGLNLPMLVRVFNYSGLDLDRLRQKAISGGKEGISPCCAPTSATLL